MDIDDRVSRRLKMSDLRMLRTVVQWRSMSKAAAHLHISQSAVSKALGELERTLGVRLLDRSRSGIEPTVYGNALLKRATAIFDEVQQGLKDIAFLSDSTAGEVQVGSTEPLAAGLLPAIIERLGRQYPRVVCQLVQAPTVATFEYRELRDRRVDLIMGRIREPFSDEDLQADVLFHEQIHIVAGKRSKWARRQGTRLAELVDEPWLLPPPVNLPRSLLDEAFRAQGLPGPRASVVSSSFNLSSNLLPTGRYLSMLPGSVLRYGALRSAVKVLDIDLPIRPRPVAIVTLRRRTLSPVAQLFIECAREMAKPLVTNRGRVGGQRR
jgi:DNA-binding transcriptional LysR family regulator